MKRFLILIALLSIMMGCKKQSYVAKFDKTPQGRAGEQIALVNNTLASSSTGWIATLPTLLGGGYSFYMTFDGKQNVTMYGDLTATSASTIGKSYYRVKQDLGTDLVFDTYNYISILDDPDAALGGTFRIGYSSDIDFIYDRMNADSIFFIGKKYRQPLVMVKATAAQQTSYLAGNLKTAIDKTTAFFTANQFPYIQVPSGNGTIKVAVSPNFSNLLDIGKRVSFTALLSDGKTVSSESAKFGSTLDGFTMLNGGLVFQGITFVKAAFKDNTTLALYDAKGKEYVVLNNPTPIININLLFGNKYTGLLSPYLTLFPGTTQKGRDIINFYQNNLNNNIYKTYAFQTGAIKLRFDIPNKRFTFEGSAAQTSGASGTSIVTYDYTVDANGNYKFINRTVPQFGYVLNIMTKMEDFLLNNTVNFDYYQDGATTYGKMSSVEDPTNVMTFQLY